MYRTKAIYQLSDLKQSSWKILRLFEIYRQSGSQAPVSYFKKKFLFFYIFFILYFLDYLRMQFCMPSVFKMYVILSCFVTLSTDENIFIKINKEFH